MDAQGQLAALHELLEHMGDWLIVMWDEPFEGWVASLHDTSSCWCHAEPDFRCPNWCADPGNLTAEMVETLLVLGLATVEPKVV